MTHQFKNEHAFKLFNVIHTDIEEGDVALIEETNQVFIYHNNEWTIFKLKPTESNVKLTMYDLNKQIMEQVPELSQKEKNDAHKIINTFAASQHQKHFMLLSLAARYFTIFEQSKQYEFGSLAAAVFACCEPIGIIKSVSLNDQGAVEIWITDEDRTECYVLFGYDEGMVYFA